MMGFSALVPQHSTVVSYACNVNGGPDILLLVRCPTLLGGQAWTPRQHSAPIRTALPEAKRAREISVSIRRRSSASSAQSALPCQRPNGPGQYRYPFAEGAA